MPVSRWLSAANAGFDYGLKDPGVPLAKPRSTQGYILSPRSAGESPLPSVLFVLSRFEMKALKPQVLIVSALIALVGLLIWLGLMSWKYVNDEWGSPAADEKSVPPARTY
jgi:hypothetical protein